MSRNTCTLWRVELPDGVGPFVSNADLDRYFEKYRNRRDFPAPRFDVGLGEDPDPKEGVACVSKQQLNYWFGDGAVIRHLSEHKAQVVKLEVPEQYITQGEYQVLYLRKHAHVVATLPLTILKPARNFKGKPKSKHVVEY